jgi:hypothetical protein
MLEPMLYASWLIGPPLRVFGALNRKLAELISSGDAAQRRLE